MLRKITSEIKQYTQFVLRWFPGSVGLKLRYWYFKSKLLLCGDGAYIATGCIIRDATNISVGNNVTFGINNQLYAGDKTTDCRIVIVLEGDRCY